MVDLTGVRVNETKFELNLLEAPIEITPDQVTEFKVKYHREFLQRWIEECTIPYSIEEIWKIREECVGVLGD